jgi:hypothetical protein
MNKLATQALKHFLTSGNNMEIYSLQLDLKGPNRTGVVA